MDVVRVEGDSLNSFFDLGQIKFTYFSLFNSYSSKWSSTFPSNVSNKEMIRHSPFRTSTNVFLVWNTLFNTYEVLLHLANEILHLCTINYQCKKEISHNCCIWHEPVLFQRNVLSETHSIISLRVIGHKSFLCF